MITESVQIQLGSGIDQLRVEGTHDGTTKIVNKAGTDTVTMIDHQGQVTFVGGPDNDKLLLDSSYLRVDGNTLKTPLNKITKMVDGRQVQGYWEFDSGKGLIVFESVERFNQISKLVTPRGKLRTEEYGIEVIAPSIKSDYSNLVANFTVGPLQPLVFDSRAFDDPDFVKRDADTTGDGILTPLDALLVINALNLADRSLYRLSYDVDKDGRVTPLDALIVINRLNQPTTYVRMGGDLQMSVRDLNNDGFEEILVSGTVNNRPALVTLNGVTGRLFDAPIYLTDEPTGFGTYIATGDLDGDGVLEVLLSSDRGAGKYSVYRRINGRMTRTETREIPFDSGYMGGVRVATGDIDGDGKDEILIGSGTGTDASVRIYDGSGGLRSTLILPSSFGRGGVMLKAGDFDGDGFDDIFVASGRRGESQIAVFSGQTSLTSVAQPNHLIDKIFTDQSLIAPMDLALVDTDGDELVELITWQLSDGRNQGTKKFKYQQAADKFFEEL
ncbi:MAG: FG-GAP-like repeat-containing protein [Pirellulaceae bacterium]